MFAVIIALSSMCDEGLINFVDLPATDYIVYFTMEAGQWAG